MEAKYLFVILNFTLFFGLLNLLGESSKKEIMTNWSERRCDFDVILSSFMYKPEDDARSASEFSSDNFSFCIQKLIDYIDNINKDSMTVIVSETETQVKPDHKAYKIDEIEYISNIGTKLSNQEKHIIKRIRNKEV